MSDTRATRTPRLTLEECLRVEDRPAYTADATKLRMLIKRCIKRHGAKITAQVCASEFRWLGHPKELRRHL
jgi:hypothetical protein